MKTGEKFKNLGRRACAMIMALTMCMSLIPDVTVFAAKSTEATSETVASVSSADNTEVNTESTGNSETSDSTKSLSDTASDTAETSTKVSTEAKSDGTSSGDTYTVTLGAADGGSLAFYEGGKEITGTSKVYTAGSTVSVKLNPDDGYAVSGFAIYGTSDNEELYSGETTDDIFEFDMPDADVTVKGAFAESNDGENEEEPSGESDGEEENGIVLEQAEFTVYPSARDEHVLSRTITVNKKSVTITDEEEVPYLDAMNSYVNTLCPTNSVSPANGYNIYLNNRFTNLWQPAAHANGDKGGYAHCTDLVGLAWNSYVGSKDNELTNASSVKVDSCLVSNAYNKIKDATYKDNGRMYTVYNNNWSVDKDGNVASSGDRKIYLKAGDIIATGTTTYDKDSKEIANSAHIMYVYKISKGTIWVADCNGAVGTDSSKGDYYGKNTTGVRSLNLLVQSDLLFDTEEMTVTTEGSVSGTLTVLRYFDNQTTGLPVKIKKVDGSKTANGGTGILWKSYSNGTAGTAQYTTCSHIASTNNGYGELSDAKFTAYKYDSDTKSWVIVSKVYTNATLTKTATNGQLKRGKTYYFSSAEIAAGKKVKIEETDVPTGWKKDGAKYATLEEGKTQIVTFKDDFVGDPLYLTLTKNDNNGTAIKAEARFTLTDDSSKTRKWVFKTIDGKIDFDEPKYLVSGTAFFNTGGETLQFFAGTYTLKETTPPTGYLAQGTYTIKGGTANSFTGGGSWTINITSNTGTGKASAKIKGGNSNEVSITNASTVNLGVNDEPEWYGFTITKTDGGTKITGAYYSNSTRGTDSSFSLEDIAGGYSAYGALSDARFEIKVGSTVVSNIYTDEKCTKKVTNYNHLVAGTKYYIKANDITTAGAIPPAEVSATIVETTTPAGWKTGTKSITLKKEQVVDGSGATVIDTFTGTAPSLTLKKLAATDGTTITSEARFTLKDNNEHTWIFKTKNGEINFSDPNYLVLGWAYYTDSNKNKMQFFAGNYSLQETTPPTGYLAKGTYKISQNNTEKKSASFDTNHKWSITITSSNETGAASMSIDSVAVTNYDVKMDVTDEEKPYPFKIIKDGADTTVSTIKADGTAGASVKRGDIATMYSSYEPISAARFTITKAEGNTTTNELKVYTTSACDVEADKTNLQAGTTYWVKCAAVGTKFTITETHAPKGWTGQGQTETLELSLTSDEEKTTTFEDTFYGTPFNSVIEKAGVDGRKLKNAVFKVTLLDEPNVTNKEWEFTTDANGTIDFSDPGYLSKGTAYVNDEGKIVFFAGKYKIEEITAPEGYLIKGTVEITQGQTAISGKSTFTGVVVNPLTITSTDGVATPSINNVSLSNAKMSVTDVPKCIGFEVQKRNNDSDDTTLYGSMTDYTTKFEVIYKGRSGDDNGDSTTWIDFDGDDEKDTGEIFNKGDKIYFPDEYNKGNKTTTWTTNSSGYYKCAAILQVGTYEIKEITPPSGMISDSVYDTFDLTVPDGDTWKDATSANSVKWKDKNDGDIVDLKSAGKGFVNSMIRGGVAGYKYDYDTGLNTAMTGSTFDGIEIWIKNANKNAVWLDTDGDGEINTSKDTKLEAGAMYKIYTLSNGSSEYSTYPTLLPVGNYVLYEKKGSNTDYIIDKKYSEDGMAFTISADMDYVLFAKSTDTQALKNSVNTKYKTLFDKLKTHTNDGKTASKTRVVNYIEKTTGVDTRFTNKVNRAGVALVKYDTDDYRAYPDNEAKPQGDGVLSGAVYEIYNYTGKSGSYIMADLDGDHVGETKINYGSVVTAITTTIDDKTGIEYAATNTTLLPNGTYTIKEKTPSVGYLKTGDGVFEKTFTVSADGQYFLYSNKTMMNTLKQVVQRIYPKTDFFSGNTAHKHTLTWVDKSSDCFTDPIMRGQLTIKKNDADRKEHKSSKVITTVSTQGSVSNDYESKYAQGDASLKDAVYEIYNISDSYVYTTGDNEGSTRKRYETGKDVFKKLTGIDTAALTYTNDVCETDLGKIITEGVAGKIKTQMKANVCYTLTTDVSGMAQTKADSLPYGTYLILEKTPSTGYTLGTEDGGITAKIFRIRSNGEKVDMTYSESRLYKSLYEEVIRGGFEVYKYDEESRMNVALGSANLEATFELINRSKAYVWVDVNGDGKYADNEYFAPDEVIMTFKTDKNTGKYTSGNDLLPYGTYEIHETYPPYGYLHMSDINPDMSVYFEIREDEKIVTDGWFFDKDGNKVTDFTHYEPVNAYDENGNRITQAELVGEKKEVYDARLIIYNYVMRGDLFFEKKSGITMKKMAYIPFLITSYDQYGNAIEKHIVFTDQNGDLNTCADYVDHTYKTNLGDKMQTYLEKYAKAYEEEDTKTLKALKEQYSELMTDYAKGVGTWFGLNTEVSDDLNRQGKLSEKLTQTGALPFGTYTIEELRCPNNDGYDMVTDTIIVDTDACETDPYTDPQSYKEHKMHSTINFGTIYNITRGLQTVALTQDTDSHYAQSSSSLAIIDTVEYENLEPGVSYKMVAELHDGTTGEILKDAWGDDVKAEKTFTPKISTGSIQMNLEFDATDYAAGGSVVVYEYLYNLEVSDEKPVMREDDITESEQTIYFPCMSSLLTTEGGAQMVKADENITLTDVITYKNFEAGKTYIISGVLKNAADGGDAKDDDGNVIKAAITETDNLKYNKKGEIIFKPSESTGSFTLTYTFNGKTLEGSTLVSFVTASRNNRVFASHEDIADEAQTVYIPKIGTTLTDTVTGTHMYRADGTVTLVDTVKYTNVKPGETYTVTGKLYNKETKETVKDADGKEITGEATFVAETTSGSVDVTFVFDATGIHKVVAFETLYTSGAEIALHEDEDDEDQTDLGPVITTAARDAVNGTSVVNPDGTVSITDTITYSYVVKGLKYTVKGTLMDKSTGTVLTDKDGKEVTADAEFTAEAENGSVDVTFTFDAEDLAGKDLVVFEYLYLNKTADTESDEDSKDDDASSDDASGEEGTEDAGDELIFLTSEANLENKDQTVYFPDLHTTATDSNTNTNISKAGKVTLTDTAAYENLVPGITYTVKGTVVDKETGEVITSDGKEVTGQAEFTPDSEDGTVDIVFTFDASDMAGKTLVVFEKLYIGEFLVKSHEDINDEAQTVYIPKIGTTLTDSETEDHLANADSEVTLTDKVAYENLIPGREYTVVGQLINKKTGKAIELTNGVSFNADDLSSKDDVSSGTDESKDAENETSEDAADTDKTQENVADDTDKAEDETAEDVTTEDAAKDTEEDTEAASETKADETDTAAESTGEKTYIVRTFTPSETDGTIDMTFIFDASGMAGESVVAYEYAYVGSAMMAEHTDINDESQTVQFPSAKTNATTEDGSKYGKSGEEITIVDKVTYTNLIVGKEYKVSGKLMDKETKEPVKDASGKEITAETKFTAEKSDGEVSLTFKLDSSLLKGDAVVVFEDVFYREKLVTSHADLTDEDQTIHVVKVSTTATDENTKSHVAATGSTVIVDEVAYEGLIPGTEYVISGKLMDKKTGKALTNGKSGNAVKTLIDKVLGKSNEYISEVKFTPDSSKGTVTVKFEIDTTAFAGKNLVVFEKLYVNGIQIAEHEDINDEGQTVSVPKIGTSAKDKNTKSKTLSYGKSVKVVDTVTYENLTPGVEYVMTGHLVYKDSGKTVALVSASKKSSKKSSAKKSAKSSSKKSDNTVSVTFTPKKSSGSVDIEFTVDTTSLVGKSLVAFEQLSLNGKVVAKHEDKTDKEQTTYVPKIGTKATVGSKKTAAAAKDTKIVDTVSYENLEVGKKYTIKGSLVDTKTKKEIGVTAKAEFTPKKTSGKTEVTFTVDTTGYEGLVVFEEVYLNGKLVAQHKDANDKDQTVTFTKTSENPPTTVRTGMRTVATALTSAMFVLIVAGMFFIRKKRRLLK